jgi:hypothetical protein
MTSRHPWLPVVALRGLTVISERSWDEVTNQFDEVAFNAHVGGDAGDEHYPSDDCNEAYAGHTIGIDDQVNRLNH